MVIVMRPDATAEQIDMIENRLGQLGFTVHRSSGVTHTILGVIGEIDGELPPRIQHLPGVQKVVRVSSPYKLSSRLFHPERTIIEMGGFSFGCDEVILMAGPCAVESETQIETLAQIVATAGARVLRGGVFKPRTSPYSFQGLGLEGLKFMYQAARQHNLKIITEVMEVRQIEKMYPYVDIFQVGTRNMQNYPLLHELGQVDRPVLLKRGFSSTIDEWLASADYILAGGNEKVILCERGVRSFDNHTRNMLDLSAVPLLNNLTHLPVVVDPSHGVGRRDLVPPMARAAIVAGADGLLIEVHHEPDKALSDGAQSLLPEQLMALVDDLKKITGIMGRKI